MDEYIHKSQYFCGHKISDYGLECGYVDYRTLAQAFDAVLNNEVLSKTSSIGYWEPVGGSEYYYEDDDGNSIQQEEYDELSSEEQDKYSECCKRFSNGSLWTTTERGFFRNLQTRCCTTMKNLICTSGELHTTAHRGITF